MNISDVRPGWAIEMSPGTLAGVFFFAGRLDPWHDGVRTAIFATRKQARAAFDAKFRGSPWYPKARVVRIKVGIYIVK